MAHYRKIDVRIWNDAKFNRLSHLGKLAFIFVLTHPNMTGVGAMRATKIGLAAELKALPEAFEEAFGEALKEGLLEEDKEASCVWVPNFIKYQAAESPNVLKSWIKQLEFIPECMLKTRAVIGLEAFAEGKGEAFLKAFREAFPNPVSSKQLAVSSNKTILTKEESYLNTKVEGKKAEAIDPETGEVLSWAA